MSEEEAQSSSPLTFGSFLSPLMVFAQTDNKVSYPTFFILKEQDSSLSRTPWNIISRSVFDQTYGIPVLIDPMWFLTLEDFLFYLELPLTLFLIEKGL